LKVMHSCVLIHQIESEGHLWFSFLSLFVVSTFLPPLAPRALPRFFATTKALSAPGHSSSGRFWAMNAVPFPGPDP